MKKKKKVRKQNNRGVIDLPMDLKVEILKKLPAKSLMRFQCVSKQWSSIISSRPDFIESIVARPLPRDTKLIVHHRLQHPNSIFIFTSTNSENKDNESVVSSNALFYQHVRGLICFNSYDGVAIYNPTTRQYLPLPKCPRRSTNSSCLFGYDPLENRYKVVCLPRCKEEPCQVFTLGNPIEKQYWRKIKGIGPHYPINLMVCVNGTIYYQAKTPSYSKAYFLVSFDVRSEIFGLVENPNPLKGPRCSTLIKYHGKLGLMSCQNGVEIWVMDNGGKKQEWSKIIFYQLEGFKNWSIRGVTHGGEIVFVDMVLRPNGQLFVYYYDAEQNSLKRVEVKGIEYRPELVYNVRPVPDHVENTMRL